MNTDIAKSFSPEAQAGLDLVKLTTGLGPSNFTLSITRAEGIWSVTMATDPTDAESELTVGEGSTFAKAWLGRQAAAES